MVAVQNDRDFMEVIHLYGFPLSISFTGAPLFGKTEKKLIFITGLHSKPQGCGAPMASAAGPFTIKKSICTVFPSCSCSCSCSGFNL
jgi:hypothetical protein